MEIKGGNIPTKSTMPSATPSAQAASTLPPTYIIFVLNFRFPPSFPSSPTPSPFNSSSASSARKYLSVNPVKLVTTFLPTNSLGSLMLPFSGTCTCSLHFPNPRSNTSSTPLPFTPTFLASQLFPLSHPPPSSLLSAFSLAPSKGVPLSPLLASCSST